MTASTEASLHEYDVREQTTTAAPAAAVGAGAHRPLADRFMRKLLGVTDAKTSASLEGSAHRYLRTSMIITGIRCLITYLLIPIAVPIIGLSGAVSAPIGLLLSLVAVVTGITSLRKFWLSDHKYRWMYTAFIAVVFGVLVITLSTDIHTIANQL